MGCCAPGCDGWRCSSWGCGVWCSVISGHTTQPPPRPHRPRHHLRKPQAPQLGMSRPHTLQPNTPHKHTTHTPHTTWHTPHTPHTTTPHIIGAVGCCPAGVGLWCVGLSVLGTWGCGLWGREVWACVVLACGVQWRGHPCTCHIKETKETKIEILHRPMNICRLRLSDQMLVNTSNINRRRHQCFSADMNITASKIAFEAKGIIHSDTPQGTMLVFMCTILPPPPSYYHAQK